MAKVYLNKAIDGTQLATVVSNKTISNHLLITSVTTLFVNHCDIPSWKSQQKYKVLINQDLVTTQDVHCSPFKMSWFGKGKPT